MSDVEVVNLFGETMADTWHGTTTGYYGRGCRCDKCIKAGTDYARERRHRLAETQKTGDEAWHGTVRGYRYYGCRCNPCKKAHAEDSAKRRQKNSDLITGDELWHGTTAGYNTHNCRCNPCRQAVYYQASARRYNLSVDRIIELLERARCKICGTSEPSSQGWHIDHDHSCCPGSGSCGKCVREILCGRCNHLIGFAKDDVDILKSAIAYIELHAV